MPASITDEAIQLIVAERHRQIAKRGKSTFTDSFWLLILAEGLNEINKSLLEEDSLSDTEGLVFAAAVMVAWLEDLLSKQQKAKAAAGQPEGD